MKNSLNPGVFQFLALNIPGFGEMHRSVVDNVIQPVQGRLEVREHRHHVVAQREGVGDIVLHIVHLRASLCPLPGHLAALFHGNRIIIRSVAYVDRNLGRALADTLGVHKLPKGLLPQQLRERFTRLRQGARIGVAVAQ